jgi:hypothetical protein|tara:strand:- start:1878 stop:2162 length:285 start_codon:yes stop_codon:yes gene_type:complete
MMPTYINNTLTIKDLFNRWIESQVISKPDYLNKDIYISNHDLESCRKWIHDNYNRVHNTSTIERAFREMREKGEINVIDASLPDNKEKRWLIST